MWNTYCFIYIFVCSYWFIYICFFSSLLFFFFEFGGFLTEKRFSRWPISGPELRAHEFPGLVQLILHRQYLGLYEQKMQEFSLTRLIWEETLESPVIIFFSKAHYKKICLKGQVSPRIDPDLIAPSCCFRWSWFLALQIARSAGTPVLAQRFAWLPKAVETCGKLRPGQSSAYDVLDLRV